MATYRLKNGQKESGTVPGIGAYIDGVLENAPENFENPNFELVTEQKPAAQAPAQAAPAAPVAAVAPAPQPQTQTQQEAK